MNKLIQKSKELFGLVSGGRLKEERVVNGIPQDAPPLNNEPGELETIEKVVEQEAQEPGKDPRLDSEDEAEIIEITPGRLPSIDKFWNFLAVSNKSKRTIQEYGYELKWWTEQAQSLKKTPYTLKLADMESLLTGIHPSTTRRKFAFLRVLAKWYLREGKNRLYLETTKFISPKIPELLPGDRGEKRFVKMRELSKELCVKGDRVGVWCGLMLMCGLRISEIKTAKIKDEKFIEVLGKGNKGRMIPAPVWLLEAMAKIPRERRGGWAKSRKTIHPYIKKLGYKPHSLRHTYASELKRRGKNIEDIKILLGHANITTTSVYAKVDVPADVALLLDR
jgi:site-specific recombinase XerD